MSDQQVVYRYAISYFTCQGFFKMQKFLKALWRRGTVGDPERAVSLMQVKQFEEAPSDVCF